MNKIIPIFNPIETFSWCSPSFFLSLIVSTHHIDDAITIVIINAFATELFIFPAIIVAVVETAPQAANDDMIGQGLLVTI